ncbi:MAG: hypothetical protein O2974_02665 [Chloroflexi bacterium]|nr:hypothetical protein [Chloroflexota bacterium]
MKITQHGRSAIALLLVLVALLTIACEDFYSDSAPTPDIAQPTPANVQEGEPEAINEFTAREAMATSLQIDASAPRKILFEHETWSDLNPGCYPAPDSLTGAYIIPGYKLLMQHEGVFYEYNADQGDGTGALCESTFQLVPAEPAYTTVTTSESATTDYEAVHIIRSEEDVAEFNSTHSTTAQIGVDEIDFPEEVLVGGWINASPSPQLTRAYKSEQDGLVIIEVVIPEEFEVEAGENPRQIWALVDAI